MATATRLFVPQDLRPGETVRVDPDQAHYLSRVLRLASGAPLVLFNGRDGEWDARIAVLSKSAADLALGNRRRPQSPEPDIWLAFAPVKKSQTDFIVQKATELGVARLIPILTDRTQSDRVRVDRLRATAVEAAEQSERLTVPEIAEPVRFDRLLATWPDDRSLYLCAEAGTAAPLATVLADGKSGSPAGFVTGPEGGFSAAELDLARRSPLVLPVGLGPRVLRAETAAVAALAVWQAVAGDGRERPPPRG
jgi:16S rRNA (uracil1498-N3)-methyltransferase